MCSISPRECRNIAGDTMPTLDTDADLPRAVTDAIPASRRARMASSAYASTQSDVSLRPLAVRIDVATRMTGLSRSDLYRRARDGELPLLKVGSGTLVRIADLERVIDNLPRAPARSPEAEGAG